MSLFQKDLNFHLWIAFQPKNKSEEEFINFCTFFRRKNHFLEFWDFQMQISFL